MTLGDIKNHIYKRTKTNSTSFPAADMLIAVNTARQLVESIIRTFVDTYQTTDWTSGDLSTGTATPIFDTLFHELIPLWVEYDYGLDNDSSWLAGVLAKIQIKEADLKRFYGARNLKIATMTIASPGVFTLNNHGFVAGRRVLFTTTGALPTGISSNTWYYVLSAGLGDDVFEVSATKEGTAIVTSGTQSGTHYVLSDQGKRLRLWNNFADSNK
jgi:uncharacterized membrane protein